MMYYSLEFLLFSNIRYISMFNLRIQVFTLKILRRDTMNHFSNIFLFYFPLLFEKLSQSMSIRIKFLSSLIKEFEHIH